MYESEVTFHFEILYKIDKYELDVASFRILIKTYFKCGHILIFLNLELPKIGQIA